ncbi:hypothetical protein LCGC14_2171280 [marine sediment metagenome]|uniref:Uncharacterized protein n=1 Tax=marine sediment metagenome TaxID=412755 RepID=A0A0F9DPV4_9ZZZZ
MAKREAIKEYLKGLIGVPMLFDGNSLCPECLHHAMDIFGGTYFCKSCGRQFPATPIVDKWGERWLKLNDA